MDGPPVRDAAVIVGDDGRVVSVEPAGDMMVDHFFDGCVLMPGLVNAHTHLEYGASFADLATSGLPFPHWIAELTRRRYALSAQEDSDAAWRAEAAAGVVDMLAAGVTAVGDIVTIGPGLSAVAEAGLAGVSYVEASGVDATRWAGKREWLTALMEGAPAEHRVGVSPHTLYTLGTSVFGDMLDLARDRGVRVHTHLAETAAEAEFVLTGSGPFADAMSRLGFEFELLASGGAGVSPAEHLAALGGLGADVHVAHGVHLSDRDRALLRHADTLVALCPRSNRILGAGVAPFADLLADGACIGTDSLASSPSLSVLDELRELRALDASLGAELLLRAATVQGAAALGLVGHAGDLRAGSRGDLAVFEVGGDPDDPYDAVLTDGTCVATVLAGVPVYGSALSSA